MNKCLFNNVPNLGYENKIDGNCSTVIIEVAANLNAHSSLSAEPRPVYRSALPISCNQIYFVL